MAITFRAEAHAGAYNQVGTSLTIAKPAGTLDNDVMLALVWGEASYATLAGWTVLAAEQIGTAHFVRLFWKRAATEGADYTFTSSGTGNRIMGGVIASYSGVMQGATPAVAFSDTAYVTNDTILRAAAVTCVGVNNMLVHCGYAYATSEITVTAPTDFTERCDYWPGTDNDRAVFLSDLTQAAAGTSGVKDATLSASGTVKHAFLVALGPALSITCTGIAAGGGVGTPLLSTTDTTVKITSPTGTFSTHGLVTDTTPTITWIYAQVQDSYCVTVYNLDTTETAYSSGWVTSSTKSCTLPAGAALTPGGDYAIVVEVKDSATSIIHSSAEWVYVHVQDATVTAPVLTAEVDTDTKTPVTLDWTAPTTTDGDTLTYEVEVTYTPSDSTDTTVTTYTTTGTSLYLGLLPAS
jgi:hypothetical protein